MSSSRASHHKEPFQISRTTPPVAGGSCTLVIAVFWVFAACLESHILQQQSDFRTFVKERAREKPLASHPRRPRGGQSGREKRRDESFQVQAEKPLGTDSHWTISKRSSECWLLIGHKNALYYCAQSGNSISWVLFVSLYTTAIDLITDCLAHAPKKCTQSGNFQFDVNSPFQNTIYPKTKDVFPKIQSWALNHWKEKRKKTLLGHRRL